MKLVNAKKTKFYWAFFILALLLALAGIIIAPVWSGTDVFFKSWGALIFDALIAFALIYYIVLCLFKHASSARGTVQVLAVVEIVILALLALSCLLSYFTTVLQIKEPCVILGIALWLRGANEIICTSLSRSVRHPVWKNVVFLLLVTLGTFLIARPLVTRVQFQWFIVASLATLCIYTILYGISAKKSN